MTIPWIKSFVDLENDPNALLLQSKMGWSNDEVISRLHKLWWRCSKYCEDGILEKLVPSQIAGMCGIDLSEGERLLKALIECQFIDEKPLRLHGWLERVGAYLWSRYHTSKPDNLQKIAKAYGCPQFPAFGGRFQKGDTVNGIPEGIPKGMLKECLPSKSLSQSRSQSRSKSGVGLKSESGSESKKEVKIRELDSTSIRMEIPDE